MTDDSLDQYRLLYEQAPVPYQSLDVNGNILIVNQAWLDELGYVKDEVIGKWFGDFLTPESQVLFRERFPAFKDKGQVSDFEFEMVRKDGLMVSVSYDGRIVKDEQGNFEHTHCVFINITERKKIESTLEHKMDELEKMNKLMVDRELKMVELKRRIEELEKKE